MALAVGIYCGLLATTRTQHYDVVGQMALALAVVAMAALPVANVRAARTLLLWVSTFFAAVGGGMGSYRDEEMSMFAYALLVALVGAVGAHLRTRRLVAGLHAR